MSTSLARFPICNGRFPLHNVAIIPSEPKVVLNWSYCLQFDVIPRQDLAIQANCADFIGRIKNPSSNISPMIINSTPPEQIQIHI